MEERLEALTPDERVLVASAFAHLLNLHNLTEEIVTAQFEKAQRIGEVEQSTRSTNKSIQWMISEQGIEPSQVFEALSTQNVELVFTAHPTQATRQSLLKKYSTIRSEMDKLHNTRMSKYEKIECLEEIRSQIEAAWRTDEIRRRKPTPEDESRQGLTYFHETIYNGLPLFLRRVDTALSNIGQPRLPLDATPFTFGSWMGGDRDGNPFVTPETTRNVVIGARLSAVELLIKNVEKLMFELSVWRASPELKSFAKEISDKQAKENLAATTAESFIEPEKKSVHEVTFSCVSEPFRVVLSEIRDRLKVTRDVLNFSTKHPTISLKEALKEEPLAYENPEELTSILKLCYRSLNETGDESMANSKLLDVIRQARTFGLHLARLDIRQESTKHEDAMDAITTYLGLGSFKAWDEATRMAFLLKELESNRPLLPTNMPMSGEVADVINTFRMLSQLPSDSLGAYIISMAHTASDVLVVVLLQKECGVESLLRVAPLFETLDDLEYAETAMRQLFSSAWYLKLINGKQECMIGYSDSGKDAGRLAAAWGLYEVQEKLVSAANEFGVHLTLFHGRGGTVGRGGAPAHLAVLSQPPKTITGTLRVTVQGEVMEQQFGEKEICFRTMDLYTGAVLEATLAPVDAPSDQWRNCMHEMSKISCQSYRDVVRGDPRFIEFFQTLTPVSELGRMNIGSRPAKRRAAGSIDTLRAIPWIFAWTQIRFHLPVWLGIGEALKSLMDKGQGAVLSDMYQNWTFFRVTMDMLEMVFAKADPKIVKVYERHLVPKELHRMCDDLLERFKLTEECMLEVMKHPGLLSSQSTAFLQSKLQLRAPYVAPLNILQVYSLKLIRGVESGKAIEDIVGEYNTDEEAMALMSRGPHANPLLAALEDTMVITMKGVAAGMQNTG